MKKTKLYFKANVELGKNITQPMEFSVSVEGDEKNLVYDDVVDAAWSFSSKLYNSEDFPNKRIDEFFIDKDGKWYPVVSETDYKKNKSKIKGYERILILPENRYALNPLFELYIKLKDNDLVSFEFDNEKMKTLANIVSKYISKNQKCTNS